MTERAEPMSHAEIELLLGAYALDAVDADERDMIDRHLPQCPKCRAEVAQHREVAAQLAYSGAAAPEGVWDRIAGSLEEPPPALELAAGRIAPLRRRRITAWRVAVGAAAAVAAGVIGVLGVEVADQRQELDELAATRTLASEADAAFADPDARTAELADADGAVLGVAVVRDDGQGYFVDRGLPRLDGRIYQLWGLAGDTAVSLGPMGDAPGVIAFRAADTFETLVVTAEAEPVEASSNPPVVQGDLA